MSRVTEDHKGWLLDIESVPATSGMFTAKATISRKRTDGSAGSYSYTFKHLGVSDTKDGALQWAAGWLREWIDTNA